jgi:hypothetical protein
MIVIGIFVSLVFLYSLISRRLERTVITAPILFTVAGMLTSLIPAWSGARWKPRSANLGRWCFYDARLGQSHASLAIIVRSRFIPQSSPARSDERKNYRHLSHFVGSGEVRRQFDVSGHVDAGPPPNLGPGPHASAGSIAKGPLGRRAGPPRLPRGDVTRSARRAWSASDHS